MAGSVTCSRVNLDNEHGRYDLLISWIGDASTGAVPATQLTAIAGDAPFHIDAYLVRIITNPGSTAPTASYDITLTDEDGIDVAGGLLANRSATLSEHVRDTCLVRGILTFTLTNNSVASATGTVRLMFQE